MEPYGYFLVAHIICTHPCPKPDAFAVELERQYADRLQPNAIAEIFTGNPHGIALIIVSSFYRPDAFGKRLDGQLMQINGIGGDLACELKQFHAMVRNHKFCGCCRKIYLSPAIPQLPLAFQTQFGRIKPVSGGRLIPPPEIGQRIVTVTGGIEKSHGPFASTQCFEPYLNTLIVND